LFRGLGNFNNDGATVELLLIQSGNGPFGRLEGGERYETIAGGTSATLDNLSGESGEAGAERGIKRGRSTYISVAAVSKKARRPWSVVE
jgi:hypothetical protein